MIKAIAFQSRHLSKDAFDLYFVLRNYGRDVGDVFSRMAPLMKSSHGRHALEVFEREFMGEDDAGPAAVATFVTGHSDDAIQAEVVGFVRELLTRFGTDAT